jgi:hypothetical protein
MDQLRFASLDYAAKKKRTSGMCLAEMAAVVPWVALEAFVCISAMTFLVGKQFDRRDRQNEFRCPSLDVSNYRFD